MAYVSTESGRQEVYLTRLADARVRIAVSQEGSSSECGAPAALLAWSHDGHTLYYISASSKDRGKALVTVVSDWTRMGQ